MAVTTAVMYNGCYDLVFSELAETTGPTGTVTATYGDVTKFSFVNQFDENVNESSQSYYFDNKPMIVVIGVGTTEVNLQISVLDLETKALIEGYDYDSTKEALIAGTKKPKYFALGVKLNKTDGTEEYRWYYKGTFIYQGQSIATMSDGTEATMDNYVFSAVATTVPYAFGTKNEGVTKAFILSTSEGAANFFDEVTTPDKIGVEA